MNYGGDDGRATRLMVKVRDFFALRRPELSKGGVVTTIVVWLNASQWRLHDDATREVVGRKLTELRLI